MTEVDRAQASEATGHDEKLHQANRAAYEVARDAAAHEVARSAAAYVERRLGGRVAAWLELCEAVESYKSLMSAIVAETVDTSPPTQRDLQVAYRMIEEYEQEEAGDACLFLAGGE